MARLTPAVSHKPVSKGAKLVDAYNGTYGSLGEYFDEVSNYEVSSMLNICQLKRVIIINAS